MAGYFPAVEDATAWPDALVTIAFLAFIVCMSWVLFHD